MEHGLTDPRLCILEITDACDLQCPACFGDRDREHSSNASLESIERTLDEILASTSAPTVIQVGGGEPTLHPQLKQILELISERPFHGIHLVTNGLEILDHPGILETIKPFSPTIYLQFDGLEPRTYEKIRGRDLTTQKRQALELLGTHGLRVVLVSTLVRHVNEHEVGALVDLALTTGQVSGLVLQPATWAGRFAIGGPDVISDPDDRITMLEVQRLITEQSTYTMRQDYFDTLDCPDPTASATGCFRTTAEQVEHLKSTSLSFIPPCGMVLDWDRVPPDITIIGMLHFLGGTFTDLDSDDSCCTRLYTPAADDETTTPSCVYNVLARERSG